MRLIDNIVYHIESIDKQLFTKQEIVDALKSIKLPVLTSNGITADPNEMTLSVNGVSHIPEKKMFEMVYYFIMNKNKMVRRENFMKDIWGDEVIVGERIIDVNVRKIRSLIGEGHIITQKGVGYRWVENNN